MVQWRQDCVDRYWGGMNRTANKSNCIVLVGLSGAGKSTVGRFLALKLNYPLCDTDAIIESEAGQAASAIFAARGETAFRALESEVLQRVMAAPPVVVATGGGIVTVPENRALIKAHAFVVWLDATTNAIVTRITNHRQVRPLLQGDNPHARLEEMRRARAALYRSVADLHILTDGIHASAVATRIAMLIPSRPPPSEEGL